MKNLIAIIISGALVVSGHSQTRNVLVGTNNAVVQPTNFWSADASNARTGLGLGTAATNPASTFQPSSATLSNLASSNGGSLTNIRATNLVGIIPASNIATVNFSNLAGTLSIASGGTGATNAANARQNFGSTTVGDALFIAANAESARTTIGATTVGSSVFTLPNPSAITFIRVNSNNTVSALTAADFRTALSLGTAATNPSSAFQPASTVLSNLASSNGAALTNISVAGVVGALATNGDAINLTNFPALLLRTNGNGAGLTNLTAANITGTVGLASNVTGTIAISNGGSGATTAGGARTNLGLGITNEVAFGGIILRDGDTLKSEAAGDGDLLIGAVNTVFSGAIGFNNTTNAATTRTNLGLGGTNNVVFNSLHAEQDASSGVYSLTIGQTNTGFRGIGANTNDFGFYRSGSPIWYSTGTNLTIANGIDFASGGAATTRSNLGLGWPALTNSNTGTGLVSVNTNGEVVSPTNFWQVAPIQTLVQDFTLIGGTQTNNATNARNLYVYSLNTNLGGVSNTIILPTNAATFNGDEVTVIHQGNTNTTTVVRQAGSTNNLITLSRFDEAVKFIRESGQWDFYHNISYVEPIQFSGTNASNNIAATRTNLGLGETNNVTFSALTLSSDLTLGSGDNIVLSTTTGTKIGTATNQLLGFYNQTPITQPSSTGVTTNGFTGGSGANVHPSSTFTGGIGTNAYTISDVVAHLKSLGLLAP